MTATEAPGLAAGQMDEVRRARRQLRAAALKSILADEEMGGVPSRALAADREMDLAARNLVRAIDGLPVQWRTKGWDRGAASSVLVLMSPECQRGGARHHQCDGSPCECSCHAEDQPGVSAV